MSEVLVRVRFAHITDTHITPGDHQEMNMSRYSAALLERIKAMRAADSLDGHKGIPGSAAARQLVDQINNLPFTLDFVLHTGDIMTDPYTPEEYQAAQELLGAIKYPIYYLNGNHDVVLGIQRVLMGRDEAAITPTLDYCFYINGVKFILVDSATNGVDHAGCLSAEQLAWLDEQVTADGAMPLVMAIHHPLMPFGNPVLDLSGTPNGLDAHQIFRKAGTRLRGIFSGHIHQAIDIYRDGVLYSFAVNNNMSSNLWPSTELTSTVKPATLPGFCVVTITADQTFIRRYSYPLETPAAAH